jgi:hypothetical protein
MSRKALLRRALGPVAVLPLLVFVGLNGPGAVAATPRSASVAGQPNLLIGPLPQTADSCSGAVCIYVFGTGLNVSDWYTTVRLSKSMCSTAAFLDDGIEIASGESTCGSSGDVLESNLGAAGDFPNETQLCNTWSGVSGEPCITVHS